MSNAHNQDEKDILKPAESYCQKGQWDKAAEECRKLLKSNPDHPEINGLLGDIHVKQNDHPQAFNAYYKVLSGLIDRGRTYQTAGLLKKIAGLDRDQLGPEARDKQTLVQLQLSADEALAENKNEDAIECLKKILKLDPLDFAAALKLAQLYEVLGRNSDAIPQYVRMGEFFLKNRQYKKAREVFKQVIKLEPQNIDGHLRLGEVYLKLENEFDAKGEYHKAAEIALAQNDLHAAFEHSLKAVELKSMDAYYVLGIVLFERKKWIDAKMKFDDFLRFKPDHVGAHVYLGKVFDAMEQPLRAVEAFQKALKMDKYNMMALEVWAEYCGKTKNIAGAVETYNILIEKAFAENQDMMALEWARLMVAVDEHSASSKLKLAQVLEKNGNLDAAGEAYFDLVSLYAKANNAAEAEKYRRKTLELKPLHAGALALNPGKAQTMEGVPAVPPVTAPAEKTVSAPVTSAPPPAGIPQANPGEARLAQIRLADHFVLLGQLNEAIEILGKLSEAAPDDLMVKEKLIQVYAAYTKIGENSADSFEPPSRPEIVITHFLNQAPPPVSESPREPDKPSSGPKSESEKKGRFIAEKKIPKRSKRKFV